MKSGSWRKYSVVVLKKSQIIERQIWQICPGEIPHCFVRGWELRGKPEWAKFLWGSKSEIQSKLLFSFSGIDVNGRKRLSPTPSVSNLSLRPCRYLSTVTRSSNKGSVDGFRREGCRDWRPLIPSRCKGVLKQNHEWKAELSCVT